MSVGRDDEDDEVATGRSREAQALADALKLSLLENSGRAHGIVLVRPLLRGSWTIVTATWDNELPDGVVLLGFTPGGGGFGGGGASSSW